MSDHPFQTLVDVLERRAALTPDALAYGFLKGSDIERITYRDLDLMAKRIAVLLSKKIKPGGSALICHHPGLEYVASFFGCLYAGVTAIPIYPPRFNQKLERLESIADSIDVKVALTSKNVLETIAPLLASAPSIAHIEWVNTDFNVLDLESATEWQRPSITGDDLAFLQFTSGSTSQPKGVMLSHSNLLANLEAIHQKFESNKDSIGLIWLPPYHDMGLIGGILEPIYIGFPIYLMSPFSFLQRPMRWLQAISDLKATISGGPNFAYDLCAKRISAEQAATLDLSRWKTAFCGAETIHPEVLEQFHEKFAPAGFKKEAFYSCYGLAEASLMVSGIENDLAPAVEVLDAVELETHGKIVKTSVTAKNSRRYVGCGSAPEGHEIKIVDPENRQACTDGVVGEIWFRGPSVAKGYYGKKEETEYTFHATIAGDSSGNHYMRTGDLGFMLGSELFITGRIKDLLIIRGRNLYPQDIEKTVSETHPALSEGSSAVFSVEADGEEKLVVVHELDRKEARSENAQETSNILIAAIKQKVFEAHDLHAHMICLVKSNTIPMTSSGKVQRQATRKLYLSNALQEIRRS